MTIVANTLTFLVFVLLGGVIYYHRETLGEKLDLSPDWSDVSWVATILVAFAFPLVGAFLYIIPTWWNSLLPTTIFFLLLAALGMAMSYGFGVFLASKDGKQVTNWVLSPIRWLAAKIRLSTRWQEANAWYEADEDWDKKWKKLENNSEKVFNGFIEGAVRAIIIAPIAFCAIGTRTSGMTQVIIAILAIVLAKTSLDALAKLQTEDLNYENTPAGYGGLVLNWAKTYVPSIVLGVIVLLMFLFGGPSVDLLALLGLTILLIWGHQMTWGSRPNSTEPPVVINLKDDTE